MGLELVPIHTCAFDLSIKITSKDLARLGGKMTENKGFKLRHGSLVEDFT
jgi:hypothetical protein